MDLRRGVALLSFSLLAACGTTADTLEEPPFEGRQGPGTSIPEDDAKGSGSATPSENAPAVPQPSAPTAPPSSENETPEAPATVTKKVLDMKWFGQETYYWCGPGSTRMALSTRLTNPPSQTQLANFMGTTTNGTDHIGLVANALNSYFKSGGYKSRTMYDPPTQAQRDLLKSDLLQRIGSGYPMVANVISGWRPPGYPSGTIYHYVAIVGYDEGGEKVLIADPAAEGHGGGVRWNAVPRTYWVSLQDLGTWIGGKGYTG